MLLVCVCTGNAFADDVDYSGEDLLVPEIVAEAYNEALQVILQDRHGDAFSEEELAELTDYVSLTFTENANSVSYFNNPDWKLELSGYYKDQDPDPAVPAHAITFSIPDEMNRALAYDIHLAYLSVLAVSEPSLSMDEFMDKVHNAINQSDSGTIIIEIGNYKLSLFSYNGRNFYGLEQNDPDK